MQYSKTIHFFHDRVITYFKQGILEDETVMPMLQALSFLVGLLGHKKEVQTISIDAGSDSVDPASLFKLRFGDKVTGDILSSFQLVVGDSVSHLTSVVQYPSKFRLVQ
jgi:hypothetical protein